VQKIIPNKKDQAKRNNKNIYNLLFIGSNTSLSQAYVHASIRATPWLKLK